MRCASLGDDIHRVLPAEIVESCQQALMDTLRLSAQVDSRVARVLKDEIKMITRDFQLDDGCLAGKPSTKPCTSCPPHTPQR